MSIALARPSGLKLLLCGAASLLLGAAIAAGVAAYPLGWIVPSAALLGYAALLWWRPAAFLLVLPLAIPAIDLGLWTGWTLIDEADAFVLTTLAILLLRVPPSREDMSLDRTPGAVLAIFSLAWGIAIAVGLTSSFGIGPSDNILLAQDNALRVGKSLIEALALLPFLLGRQRMAGDAVRLLSTGLVAGLVAVTVIVAAERLLFADLLDFSGAYRVAGPFSSMRVGGGHIGAYTALVLPFTLCLATLRPRWFGIIACLLALVCGTYTLAATLARTGYAAGAIGLGVTGVAWVAGRGRRGGSAISGVVPVLIVILVLAGIASFTGMRARFADTAADFSTREGNWRAGLAVRDTGVLPTVFGMGLGTYQRAMFTRSDVNRPSNLALRREGSGRVLVFSVNTPFYLGQKVPVDGTPLRIRLRARAIGAQDGVTVSLCDKVLLYADQCQSAGLKLPQPGVWQSLDAQLETHDLGRRALFGWLHRPVELSVFGGPGQIEVADVSVTDAAGGPVLANSGFEHGLDRWLITDDSHVSWRMLNVYLMLFFETGMLGLLAYLALAGVAMASGLSCAMWGSIHGAAIVGGIVSFLVSGLFDDVLEAPRVATLFFLILGAGILEKVARPRGRLTVPTSNQK